MGDHARRRNDIEGRVEKTIEKWGLKREMAKYREAWRNSIDGNV